MGVEGAVSGDGVYFFAGFVWGKANGEVWGGEIFCGVVLLCWGGMTVPFLWMLED